MRPQLRAARFLQVREDLLINPQFALSSPVGTDFFQTPTSGPEGLQLGEENGWPNVESRLGVGFGVKEQEARYRPLEFGVSGAVGELRFFKADFVNPAAKYTTLVWMYGADFRWQITSQWAFTAEGFYGNALGSYAARTKQTFNRDTGEGVRASGGFLELEYKLTDQWIAHGGSMIDNPLDKDVASDNRTYQQNAYSNLMYIHSRYLQVGFELAHLWAGFKGTTQEDNKAWVVQNKIIFTF